MRRLVHSFAFVVGLVTALAFPAGAFALVSTWQQQCSTSSCAHPSPRAWAPMAYDPSTGTAVLFGGVNSGPNLRDTWLWKGSTGTWARQSPTASPVSGAYGAMAYDPSTQTVVLVTSAGETWLWNGSTKTWTKQATKVAPPARSSPAMAFDSKSRTVILFGGDGAGGSLSDTWSWNGATKTWTTLSPATRPSARTRASMATDPATGSVVLFGGRTSSGDSDETWTWDGAAWTKLSPPPSPPARGGGAMAADNTRLVLFGGGDGTVTGLKGDTWAWDGTPVRSWSPQVAAGPEIREGASMAYDGQRVLLFGGLGEVKPCTSSCGGLPYAPNQWLEDTWTYEAR